MKTKTAELTAEEFIREKIREKNQFPEKYEMEALHRYTVTGEDCLRWAHEFSLLNHPPFPSNIEIDTAARKSCSGENKRDQFIGFMSGVKYLRDFINHPPVMGEGWVSVDERFPEELQEVMFCSGDSVLIGYYSEDCFYSTCHNVPYFTTYWKNKPTPPHQGNT